MNKGIIMEVKQNYAIVMNDDGHMNKISKKKNMSIGQKIFYFEEDIIRTNGIRNLRNNSFIKTIGSIAALFLIAFTFFYQLSYKESAYAVVSLDINPSIQIEVDNNKTILKVEGMNDDGKSIDFKDLKGLNINEGIQKIKNILVEKNYLKENRDVLVAFALVNDDENEDYEESVKGAIQSTFKSEKVTYVKGNKEDVKEAKSAGISLGRYEVLQVADENEKKEIDKAPVKEITELIKDKENVIQWGDDKNNAAVKVPGSEVVDEPENNSPNKDSNVNNTNVSNNNNNNNNEGHKKPVINGAVDSSSNANTNNNNNSGAQKPDDDIIIEVPPENKPEEETVPPNKEDTIPEKEPAKPSGSDNTSEKEENNNSENDNKNEENDNTPVQGETK